MELKKVREAALEAALEKEKDPTLALASAKTTVNAIEAWLENGGRPAVAEPVNPKA